MESRSQTGAVGSRKPLKRGVLVSGRKPLKRGVCKQGLRLPAHEGLNRDGLEPKGLEPMATDKTKDFEAGCLDNLARMTGTNNPGGRPSVSYESVKISQKLWI